MYFGIKNYFFHVVHSLLNELKYFHLFVKLFLSDGKTFYFFYSRTNWHCLRSRQYFKWYIFIFKYYFTQEYIFLIFLKSILLTFLDAKLLMKLLCWNLASAQLFQFWAKVMYMSEIVFFVLKNGGSTNDTLSPILMVLNLKLPLILI